MHETQHITEAEGQPSTDDDVMSLHFLAMISLATPTTVTALLATKEVWTS